MKSEEQEEEEPTTSTSGGDQHVLVEDAGAAGLRRSLFVPQEETLPPLVANDSSNRIVLPQQQPPPPTDEDKEQAADSRSDQEASDMINEDLEVATVALLVALLASHEESNDDDNQQENQASETAAAQATCTATPAFVIAGNGDSGDIEDVISVLTGTPTLTTTAKSVRTTPAVDNAMATTSTTTAAPTSTATTTTASTTDATTSTITTGTMAATTATTSPTRTNVTGTTATITAATTSTATATTNTMRSYSYDLRETPCGKGYVAKDIPAFAKVVAKTVLAKIRVKAATHDQLMKVLTKKKRFNWSERSRVIMAVGIAQIPYTSWYGLEQALPCFIYALLIEAGFDVTPEQVAAAMPSKQTVGEIVAVGAGASLRLAREEIRVALAVFFGCDKGHRDGVDHFAKVLSWFNFKLLRVLNLCLDIDGSGGSSADAADAINHSVMEKLGDASKPFSGQTTDSGGGGVLQSLRINLEAHHLVDPDYYLVAPCCLHGLQKPFDVSMIATFGEGGLDKRNVLQLVHTCYDMQECYPGDLFATAWNAAKTVRPTGSVNAASSVDRMIVEEPSALREDDDDPDAINRMSRPVLTRWWYVSVACEHLVDHFDDWMNFFDRIVAKSKSGSKEWKIASNGSSLIREPRLLCDAWFVVGFARSFFHNHFKWLQGHDDIAQDYGYRGRHMLERYYLMSKDLDALTAGSWKTDPKFAEFRQHRDDLPRKMANFQATEQEEQAGTSAAASTIEQLDRLAQIFLAHFQQNFHKHFSTWKQDKDLVAFAFAGNARVATSLAKWVRSGGTDLPAEGDTTCSLVHGKTVLNLRELILFIACTPQQLALSFLVKHHVDAVDRLAQGESLWGMETADPDVLALKQWCQAYQIPLMTSTHRVEGQIREASLVASTGRGESARSAVALIRSSFNRDVDRQGYEAQKSRRLEKQQSHDDDPQDGEEETSGDDPQEVNVRTPRGSKRTTTLLEMVDSRLKLLDGLKHDDETKKKVVALYKKKTSSCSEKRRLQLAESIRTATTREPNVHQRKTGITETALARGMILFKDLRAKDHRDHIKSELLARGVTIAAAKPNWVDLRKLLKEYAQNHLGWVEGNELAFTPMTDYFKQYLLK
jgi:hypothetical protein